MSEIIEKANIQTVSAADLEIRRTKLKNILRLYRSGKTVEIDLGGHKNMLGVMQERANLDRELNRRRMVDIRAKQNA